VQNEGQDFCIPTQARLLAELVEALDLGAPSIAGHDIGGAIPLRAHLLEGVPFACIALIDSVALRSWITPATKHVKAHLDAYRTMPTATFEALVSSHLRELFPTSGLLLFSHTGHFAMEDSPQEVAATPLDFFTD
jgi:pimeloyl-ACP methyl ester carboxylesterase